MKNPRRFLLTSVVMGLVLAGCPERDRLTPEEKEVQDFAVGVFSGIRTAVDPGDNTDTTAQFIGNHVEVASGKWVYVLDNTGRQAFRPRTALTHLTPSFSEDLTPTLETWKDEPVPEDTIDEAKDLAQSLLAVDYTGNPDIEVIPIRELIASRSTEAKAACRYYEGRTRVLFSPMVSTEPMVESYESSFVYAPDVGPIVNVGQAELPARSHETAITFGPEGEFMRAESTRLTPEVQETVAVLREGLTSGAIRRGLYVYDPNLQFGTFFDPEEYRFELTAYSYEGEEFLDPDILVGCTPDTYVPTCNPFYSEFFPYEWCLDYSGADAGFYTTTQQYRYWCWFWWLLHYQKNGIRGNWDAAAQSWEMDVSVLLHRPLQTYGIVGTATGITPITTCDGLSFDAPLGTELKLEDRFYDDLERCHIALISTHGGPIYSARNGRAVYHFRRDYDRWIMLHEEGDDGLGHGNLRHLFLETCAAINWIYGPEHEGLPKTIETDWMNHHVADGIRTVCGVDGAGVGWDRGGWRFFGSYHRGESISQSWYNALIEECDCNHPVVLAYGSTETEAASTLFDGRFTKTRGGTGWVMACEVWVAGP